MKLIPIECNKFQLDGGAMFGNAPKALWNRWTSIDEQNRIPLATRALLWQTEDGRNILFEAGVGAFYDPKMKQRYGIDPVDNLLITSLGQVGLRESDIDAIVLSHLHFDHCGGLLSNFGDGPLRLLFSKATYYVSATHWKRALSPHLREQASFIPALHDLLQASGRLKLVETEKHADLPAALSFRYVEGHTVGQMLSVLDLEPGPILFASDLIPGIPWVHLPIAMGYDRFPEKTVDEKIVVLNWLEKANGFVFFTHDIEVACGKVMRDEAGKFIVKAEPGVLPTSPSRGRG